MGGSTLKNLFNLLVLVAFLAVLLFPGQAVAGDGTSLSPPVLDTSFVKVSTYSLTTPYTETYYNAASKTYVAVISQLPMVNARSQRVQVGWIQIGASFVSLPNQFEAVITGTQIYLTAINDQPSGAKTGDYVTWNPQLFIGGKEIKAGEPHLLSIDPINSNYSNNVIEWTYGSVIRRVRIIEGLFSERWIVPSDPYGTVEVVHNLKGSLGLHLGYCHDSTLLTIPCYVIGGDIEVVYASSFSGLTFPVEIGATENFSPNPHVEATSVDGYTSRDAVDQTWANIRLGAGVNAYDSVTYVAVAIRNSATANQFSQILRSNLLFNTSGLPDTAVISSVNMTINSIGGLIQVGTPEVNVFGSNPASNVAIVAADFQELQNWWTVPYSTAKTMASLIVVGNYTYTFNAAGIAAISLTGISKFSLIESKYDAGNTTPPYVANDKVSYVLPSSAEGGSGKAPILEVVYTLPPTVTLEATTNITATTAILHGNITSTGGGACDTRGFDWDIDSGAPYANSLSEGGSFGTGAYTNTTGVFPCNTKIYIRAKAHNSAGTGYSAEGNFTTLACPATPPGITTKIVTGFEGTWAQLNGEVTLVNDTQITEIGFDYGLTSTSLTTSWTRAQTMGLGTFSGRIDGLTRATQYWYRAKAKNSTGAWGYGTNMTFATQGSDSLFEYLNTGDDSNIEVGGTNTTGQTFTTPDVVPHTISQVRVKIYSEGTPGTLYAKIYHTSAGLATGLPIGQGDISTVGTDPAGIWYTIPMDEEVLPDADTMYALVLSAPSGDLTNSIHWMVDTGNGYADGTEITSTNSGITWATVPANDMMFEIWGTTSMSINNAQVFRSILETGDQLFVAAYKVVPDDDRRTDDCTRYFNIQILEGSTIRGQVKMPAWGYKPVGLYLSADAAVSWGAVNGTKMRIAGTTGSDFSTYQSDYELTASDWRGSDLTFLDTWVIIQAGNIEDYYSATLVVYVGDTALLNDLGGTIFTKGIPGLDSLRPEIFQTGDKSDSPEAKTHGTSYFDEIKGFFGTRMQSTWESLSDLLGVDASFVGTGFWFIIGGCVIAVVGGVVGHSGIALVISVPFFLVGAFGGLDLRYLLLITSGIMLIVLAKFTIWRS